MNDSVNIVVQDQKIAQILASTEGQAASLLFEHYRIAGRNQDVFVAALIARLCMAEARRRLNSTGGKN